MLVNRSVFTENKIDTSAVKASLGIVCTYFSLAGAGLLLLTVFQFDVTQAVGSIHYIQDFLFLLFSTFLLFILIYRIISLQNSHKNQARHNELRYLSLFNNMRDGASVYRCINEGQDFVIVDTNRESSSIEQGNHEGFGNTISEGPKHTSNFELLATLQRVYSTGQPEFFNEHRIKNQHSREWHNNYIFKLDTGEVVTLSENITQKKLLENQLKKSKLELSLHNRILTQFLTCDDDCIYLEILKILTANFKSEFGFFANHNNNDILIGTSVRGKQTEQTNTVQRHIISIKDISNTAIQTAINSGITTKYSSQQNYFIKDRVLHNCIFVPIRYREKVIGLICIGDKPAPFTSEEQILLEKICFHIAPILKARLWAQHIEKLHFKASAELVNSESNLRKAEHLAQIGHWEHDIVEDKLTWSREVYNICSLDPLENILSVDAFLELVHPDDREFVYEQYQKSVQNKQIYDITHRLLLRDGSVKTVHERCITSYDNDGEAIRSLGTVQDISKTVQAQASHKRLATAIDQTVDVIVITDPGGLIQYVNPAFEQLTGYTKEEAIGVNPSVLQSGQHSSSFYRELWDTISSGNVWHGRFINKTKDGKFFTEEASITPIKDDTGAIINFVAVKHDISRELELEQQLRHAAKMEAMGTLAGGIAHDFNNILGAILGYTRMAMEDITPESQPWQDLKHVITSGNRAADLIKQILLFSRHQKQGFVPVQVEFIIKESLRMLRASLPSTITLNEKIEVDCPPIMADPAQIHQIIMNICTNAKQAMLANSGTLSIHLSKVDACEPEIANLTELKTGTYIKLMVSDTGYGIHKDHLDQIFDPFFSTKGIKEGTGLGLAVTHGIVTSHHGIIQVESEIDKGTTFTIFLPATDSKIHTDTEQYEAEIPGGDEHILVVDDEHSILTIRQRLLTGLGYKVTTFSSSIDALRAFRENPLQFDLLLTDMTMPKMDGIGLTENLLAIRPNMPVVMCSGHSEHINEKNILEHGIRAFLLKPVAPMLLAKSIRKTLDSPST